jgi:hypothetical protein
MDQESIACVFAGEAADIDPAKRKKYDHLFSQTFIWKAHT